MKAILTHFAWSTVQTSLGAAIGYLEGIKDSDVDSNLKDIDKIIKLAEKGLDVKPEFRELEKQAEEFKKFLERIATRLLAEVSPGMETTEAMIRLHKANLLGEITDKAREIFGWEKE